ncbi:hypothetical protein AB685_00950 [Bacillus sp. LL01]|uniref:DUF4129 domain-containing protein n=1 Tax=Bacillus sp. LL01 TaxID=1665556 RepID=UPI00064CF5AC|nr:DUF4129 domain-containing protein [Bacillus sp. LL01]KMJ59480.1 hypothetical protein AB685_00950 [Bacillus sp. LL01]
MLKEKEARGKLEEILKQDEYRIYYADNRNSLQMWWDEVKAWLADLLSRLFPSMENTSGTAGNILILILGLVIIFMVVVLSMYISRYRKNRAIKAKQPFQSSNEMEWSYFQHVAEAKKYEDLEDYSLATRHLFLGILLFFHEKEWLEAKIWKTNWEYFEELKRGHKNQADLFFNFALLFDRATYGKQQVLKEEYQRYRDVAMKWIHETHDEG